MKDWRPHVDLARLSAALAEDILAATDEDLRAASGGPGRSVAGAAQEVRDLIEDVNGEHRPELDLLLAECVHFRAACARQH